MSPDESGIRWRVLALTIASTAIGMMGFASVFPLLNLWIRDFGISHAEGGLLSGLWYLPGLIISLPAGWAFDRYSMRRVLGVCWLLIVGGVGVMAVAPSFLVLCAGRLLFAIGMNAHMIGAPKLIGTWFAGRKELGLVMGLYTLAFTAGVYLSLKALGSIASDHGWRPAMTMLAGMSVAGALLIALIPARTDSSDPTSRAGPAPFRPLRLGVGVWVLSLAYFGYSIGTEAYLTFTPDLLVQRGYQLALASSIVGSYALVAFVLKPITSSFLRPATATPFVVMATLLALVSIGLLFSPLSPRVSASVLGVSMALGMPAFLALPTFVLSAERSGQGYGLYQMFYSMGFFAQPLVGYAADRNGGYAAGYVVVALYCALGLLVVLPGVTAGSGGAREQGSGRAVLAP